jgi:hypothetical protein
MKPTSSVASILTVCAMALPLHAQVLVFEFEGTNDEQAGLEVATLGDVNADGHQDFAFGSPYGAAGRGTVTVVSGWDGSVLRTHVGQAVGDLFGWAIAGVGDLQDDGHDDYVVGAPSNDASLVLDAGAAYVYSGKLGNQITKLFDAKSGSHFGWAACGLGAAALGSGPDFAIGAPNWYAITSLAAVGRVVVYSGPGTPLWDKTGFEDGQGLGASLANAGDVDHDGAFDLIVGAPFEDVPGIFDAGVGRVFSGASGTFLAATAGTTGIQQLSARVAGLGDIDFDGKVDVAYGSPLSDAAGQNSGELEIRPSGSSTFPALHKLLGAPGEELGSAVVDLGDQNADGFRDFAVGGPGYDLPFGLVNAGRVQIVSGKDGTTLQQIFGPGANARAGWSMDSIDLNADGRKDLIIGAPGTAGTPVQDGRVRAYLMGLTGPSSYCTAKVNSAGCTPEIGSQGAPSLSMGPVFQVTASGVLAQMPGLLLWSMSPGASPFGGGTLCVSGSVKRTAGQSSNGSILVPCSGTYAFTIGLAFAFLNGLQVGDTLYTQYWSRDNGFASPNNMGLTDALTFQLLP